jgi:hypothetical protein
MYNERNRKMSKECRHAEEGDASNQETGKFTGRRCIQSEDRTCKADGSDVYGLLWSYKLRIRVRPTGLKASRRSRLEGFKASKASSPKSSPYL